MRWTEESLARTVGGVDLTQPWTCATAVRRLGPMAVWWLATPVLEAAGRDPHFEPSLSAMPGGWDRAGSAAPLLVWSPRPPLSDLVPDLLRQAFVLPVQWRRNRADGGGLPAALLGAAARVRAQLGLDGFGLRPNPAIDGVDLRALTIEPGSAWAALAGGLWLAAQGFEPAPGVFATVAFTDQEGPEGVHRDTLAAKLEAAAALGGHRVFVAAADLGRARRLARELGTKLDIASLKADADPLKALAPYLAALRAPPARGAAFDERRDYFRQLRRSDPPAAARYYRDHLLDDLLARAEEASQDLPDRAHGGILLSMLSTNPEVALFAVRILRPRRCVFLHTEETDPAGDENIEHTVEAAKRICGDVQLEPMRRLATEDAAEIADRVASGSGATGLALDCTPGPKDLVIAIMERLRPRLEAVVYLHTDAEGRERLVGSEQLVCLSSRGGP